MIITINNHTTDKDNHYIKFKDNIDGNAAHKLFLAKDAYLNVVVGNAYYTKFSKDAARFIRENPGRSYSLTKLFDYDIKRGEETAWIAGSQGTILQVHKTMVGNDILVEMDKKVFDLLGEDIGLHFENMRIAGIINDDPEMEDAWYSDVQYSDTAKGQQVFLKLLHDILMTK